jgi:glycosyltransferase involved in cell wall biosynthesis
MEINLTKNYTVSVIICAYTEERLSNIIEVVDSVRFQTRPADEIILSVDHNPTLAEKLSHELHFPVKIIHNIGTRGLSETRNVGIRSSTGEIIAFIDDDAIADRNWLLYLITPFQNENVAAVGGKAIPLWFNDKRPLWFPEEIDWIVGCTYKGLPVKDNQIRNVPGCSMAFRKKLFNSVGFFRTDIGGIGNTPRGGEEADLCLRLKQRDPNIKIIFEERSLIYHHAPATRMKLSYVIRRSFNEGYYKRIVEKLSHHSQKQSLSTENSYLKYLIFQSIPKKIGRFYRISNLAATCTIIVCIFSTSLGYLVNMVKKRFY